MEILPRLDRPSDHFDVSGRQRQAGTATPALVQDSTNLASFSPAQEWQYQGDFSYFNGDSTGVATLTGLTLADVATWVRVRLFRMDTYAELTTGGANTNFMVGGFADNRTNPSITLYVGDDAGGASLDTSALPHGAALIQKADRLRKPGSSLTRAPLG